MSKEKINLFWMRRDMRLEDNAALYHALKGGRKVLPLFIFDKNILDPLSEDDRRVSFLYDTIDSINSKLESFNRKMCVRHGKPSEVFADIFDKFNVGKMFAGRDYEPYAKERDKEIHELASKNDVEFTLVKEHVLMHRNEVTKSDGDPYLVYTPYMKTWKEQVLEKSDSGHIQDSYYLQSYPVDLNKKNIISHDYTISDLGEMGFKRGEYDVVSTEIDKQVIKHYDEKRDYPALEATSRLSVHLRFGTLSIRKLARTAAGLNETFLDELIWRDFYSMILDHFPRVVNNEFRAKYSGIPWENDEELFQAWKEGKTGFALVDAGMRQLNEIGFMHNRVRMLVASVLTKHFLIDWRWGEAYFAEKLMDYDLASNNGGWQWAAGCGTDAAPYFRIFNPHTQIKKWDKDHKYIKKWVPEFEEGNYREPVVEHKEARQRALDIYKQTLEEYNA